MYRQGGDEIIFYVIYKKGLWELTSQSLNFTEIPFLENAVLLPGTHRCSFFPPGSGVLSVPLAEDLAAKRRPRGTGRASLTLFHRPSSPGPSVVVASQLQGCCAESL